MKRLVIQNQTSKQFFTGIKDGVCTWGEEEKRVGFRNYENAKSMITMLRALTKDRLAIYEEKFEGENENKN